MTNNRMICKLATVLNNEVNSLDFVILKDNYNRMFDRYIDTKIIYVDDDYEDVSFFSKRLEGDDFFLKAELLKQIQMTIDVIKPAPFDEQKKLNLVWDEFEILIRAIAVSKGLLLDNYKQRLHQLINR